MNKAFEKIIEKLEEMIHPKQLYFCKYARGGCKHLDNDDKDCMECVVENAIEIVKQEAEQYNNGWIPCSEQLPKYGEVVMCSCTNSGITISCITHKGVKPSKSVRFGQHSVIAWQPLQQPYQPKGE